MSTVLKHRFSRTYRILEYFSNQISYKVFFDVICTQESPKKDVVLFPEIGMASAGSQNRTGISLVF